jgi:hypothetical protein
MATFYLFNNADFDGSYTISAGGDKTWSSARTVAGTISKVKIVFTNTGKAKVSARLMIDGKSQGLASEKTYSAGTNTITIIAEDGDFNVNSTTGVKVANGSSAASIVVKGIEVTYTASSSGGGDSGGGSGGDTTPSVSGSAIFPSPGTFTQTTTLGVFFNISFSNCEYIEASLYDTISGETIAESGRITGSSYADTLYFTLNKGDNYNLRAEVFYMPISSGGGFVWGNTYYPNGNSTYAYRYIGDLGSISAPSVNSPYYGRRSGTSFIYPGETYTLSWSAPATNGNTINGYQCLFNGNLFNSSNSTSISIGNNLNEKESGEWKIKAVAGTNPETSSSISSGTYVYNLKIDTQDSITINNSTLASGSAGFSWEPALINVNDSILGNFTVQYNLKYKTSSDKISWSSLQTIASNLTSNQYTIEEIGNLGLTGKFVCFVIENNIYYNSSLIKTITTEELDGFIKYAGEKPNQLSSIIFESSDLKGRNYLSKYIYNGTNFIWETFNYKYITKGSTLTINFGELAAGYAKPGVKISWERGSYKGSKEFYENNTSSTTSMVINFVEDDFFNSNFWNSISTSSLILTITSLGYIETINTTVLEEERGFFYKGSDIQVAKNPIVSNTDAIISPTSKSIPVNFTAGNQEPIVDEANGIYEDLKINNIKATHPQEIEIFAYEVSASVLVNNTWKDYQVVTDNLLSATKGGGYSTNESRLSWFIPDWNVEDNKVIFGLNILNSAKNSHLTALLGSEISQYNQKLTVDYRIFAIDVYGQKSNNYFSYSFTYDCRKPAIFEISPQIQSPTSIDRKIISPYGNDISVIPVFNGDNLIIKFYPAINPNHYNNNQNNYFNYNGKTYLKHSSDNSIIDPNYYRVYKFIKNSKGNFETVLIDRIEPFSNTPIVTKESETLGEEEALYYRYQLNFNLENKDIDEVEYFQIVPFYEDGGLRISRIHYYEDNSNGFNIDNAIFWNSRIGSPKVQVTGVERIATTEDDFGFELPKLKLYVTDWGTTHQFYDGEKLTKEQLVNYNRLTDLTYSIKYYEEKVENGVTSEEYLSGKDWGRNYLINSAPSITYNDLASEYNYASFEELKTHTEKDLSSINGNDYLPVVTSGTTLYVNLPSPIEGTSASATNFFAKLTINGKINRVSKDSTEASFKPYSLQLIDYSIYISQNKKTFMIQQGKLGINQPELKEVEESLYIVDKKTMSGSGVNHPNILGLEADRTFNKINNITGAFVGFYDDSSKNKGDRILMGSIGLGMTLKENSEEVLSYEPYVFYNADATGTMTALKLVPEAGDYIEIEGHRISHKTPVAGGNTSLLKVGFDNFGHITASAAPTTEEIRQVAHIKYGDLDPSDVNNNIVGEEGDIYLWIQSE